MSDIINTKQLWKNETAERKKIVDLKLKKYLEEN
tara:strand:- start:7184 stop:7285 length:102 start_codon:yes stop_codon:yes gene_type:complete